MESKKRGRRNGRGDMRREESNKKRVTEIKKIGGRGERWMREEERETWKEMKKNREERRREERRGERRNERGTGV